MNILPIRQISETDQPIFGANLFNLAKLARADYSVLPGIAVSPPQFELQTILKLIKTKNEETMDQKLTIVRKEIRKIPCPKDLEKELDGHGFYLNAQVLEKHQVWPELLKNWLEQLKIIFWKQGFSVNMLENLTAQAVFSTQKRISLATAYFDPDLGDTVIKTSQKVSPAIMQTIDQLVISANKKLFLPQVYNLILTDKEVYLVGLGPFTQTLPVSQESDVVISKDEQKKLVRSAIKIFLNLSSGFAIPSDADGVLVEGERIEGFDETVFKLAEAALSFSGKPVIYKLPESLLDMVSQAFLFARTKKSLLNLELGIPQVRSCQEYTELKQELFKRGISRQETLKFWLEVAAPENVINIQDYLREGIDGVILETDILQRLLGGYEMAEGQFYGKQVQALVKFIGPVFKILHRVKVPILAKGELILHPEILDFLVEEGVFGVVANNMVEAESLPEHLNWAERRMVAKRFV